MDNIYFDSSDFEAKFDKIVRSTIPELIEKGLGRAMLQLLNDCVMEVPTVPLREGWLRGSGSVFVQNALVYTTELFPTARPKYALKNYAEAVTIGDLVGVIGFNAPYAAKTHEGIDLHFREPSSGPKYLESKMLRNRETYALIIANTIKEGGND